MMYKFSCSSARFEELLESFKGSFNELYIPSQTNTDTNCYVLLTAEQESEFLKHFKLNESHVLFFLDEFPAFSINKLTKRNSKYLLVVKRKFTHNYPL